MIYPVTRGVVLLSLVLTITEITLKALGDAHGYHNSFFSAKPGWYAPWTLVTAPYCGRHPALAAFHIAFLYATLYFFERAWGSRSLGKFVLLVSVVPVGVAWIFDTIIGRKERIGGAAPLVIAFLVALKQANPFTYRFAPLNLEIKPKDLVMPALGLYTLLGLLDLSIPIMAWTSLCVSWWYLRFIKSLVMDQLEGPTRTKGDRSDAFRFSKFFYPRRLTNALLSVEIRFEQKAAAPVLNEAQRQQALGERILGGAA